MEYLKSYLKYLGFSDLRRKILFVTTHDLAEMSFCPNKVYLQVNYLGGISEYDFRFKVEEKELARECFKRKIEWRLTDTALKAYTFEELWSFSFLSNGIQLFPEEMQKLKIRVKLPKKVKQLIDEGIFPSYFRVNFGQPPFFISGVPDVVLIEDGKIKGVIEVKSSKKFSGKIFPSEYEQTEFYKLYFFKRKLPVKSDTYFLTLKGLSDSPETLEERLINALFSTKNFEKDYVEGFATSHSYLIKEVEESLENIGQKLNERINVLSLDSIPSKHCPWNPCSFKEFCKNFDVL